MNKVCDICGHDYWYDEHEESSDCRRCEKAEAAICRNSYELIEWVQGVAKKAAEDAVNAARAKLVGEE